MANEVKVPRLMQFLFGEAAETAQRGASERLRRWSEGFEGWMGQREENGESTSKQANLAWKRLLRERRKMPWELTTEDLRGHAEWMQAEGYAPTTIYNMLGIVSSFYRWCGEHQVDPEAGAQGFNPAAGVMRPKIKRYRRADGQPCSLLSRQEMGALVGVLRQDETPLGKRDYALILACLRMGAPARALRGMKWEARGLGKRGDRAEGAGGNVPREVREAIYRYLEASGRMEGMMKGDYIFAPLAEPGVDRANDRREDWAEGRCVSMSQLLSSLKVYGRAACIAEEKLTLQCLRRTATRWRLEAGSGLEEMKSFLNSREEAKSTRHRLKQLPPLPQDDGETAADFSAPDRKAKPFKAGDGLKHGMYAQEQPVEGVLAVLRENVKGVEEEVTGLRRLARGLLTLMEGQCSSSEAAVLREAYTLAARRLGAMIEMEQRPAQDERGENWAEKVLARLDAMAAANGKGPISEAFRREAAGLSGEAGPAVSDRRLVEEVASVRYILRGTLREARRSMERGEIAEYVRMTEIYGSGCNRLMRLLKASKAENDRLSEYMHECVDRAIEGVLEDFRQGIG